MEMCNVILVHQCNRTFKYNIKYIVIYAVQVTSVYALYNCVIFLTALEGGRDIQCRCDSKKVKVHAENIYPHMSPEVPLPEVCVPLDTFLAIAPLLLSDSCLSAVHLETAMADIEMFGRGIVQLSGL
jgi:hypothetical protein